MDAWCREGKTITLKLHVEDRCEHLTTAEHTETSPHRTVVKTQGFFGQTKTQEIYAKTRVVSDSFKVTTTWTFLVYCGDEPDENIKLSNGQGQCTKIVRRAMSLRDSDATLINLPYPALETSNHEVDLTWLIRCLPSEQKMAIVVGEVVKKGQTHLRSQSSAEILETDPDVLVVDLVDTPQVSLRQPTPKSFTFSPNRCNFNIDRSDVRKCHTPSRNKEMEGILQNSNMLTLFCENVSKELSQKQLCMNREDRAKFLYVPRCNAKVDQVHVPVAASFLFNDVSNATSDAHRGETKNDLERANVNSSIILVPSDLNAVVAQHCKDLYKIEMEIMTEMNAAAEGRETTNGNMIDEPNIRANVGFRSLSRVLEQHHDAIGHIEAMLYEQLHNAVGKELTSRDFDDYMRFHYTKILAKDKRPKGFAMSVRQNLKSPVGELSILASSGRKESSLPINTLQVHQILIGCRVPLTSSIDLKMNGQATLHAFVSQQFSGTLPPTLSISARARQFSSFILLLGRLPENQLFVPDSAIIVRNKDDLLIPLLTETIPTQKEFKKAIKSMSKTQQRFAEQYRSMQMGKTIFAMATINIQPQLEKVLNLSDGALTKEIQVRNDLMKLLLDYQIPTDMLKYDQEDEARLESESIMQNAAIDTLEAETKSMTTTTTTTTTTKTTTPVSVVRRNVKRVMDMVREEQEEEIRQVALAAAKKLLEEKKQATLYCIVPETGIKHSLDSVNVLHGTVMQIKTAIMRKCNVMPNTFSLWYGGREMKDTDMCLTYDILPQGTVVMRMKSQPDRRIGRMMRMEMESVESCVMLESQLEMKSESLMDNSRNFSKSAKPIKRGWFGKSTKKAQKRRSTSRYTNAVADVSNNICDDMMDSDSECESSNDECEEDECEEDDDDDDDDCEVEETKDTKDTKDTKKEQERQKSDTETKDTSIDNMASSTSRNVVVQKDWTKMPNLLTSNVAKYSDNACLRPTILTVGQTWVRETKPGLLSKSVKNTSFSNEEQQKEKNRAYDLLDALTTSGELDFDNCHLHVVMCATHCFDQTLLDVICQSNVNPVEVVERSAMIMACTIHGVDPLELVEENERGRMELYSSSLF